MSEITCDRCEKRVTTYTMSMFNTDVVCLNCKDKEIKHPDYEKARQKELEEVIKGNYNYVGIGKPEDL